MQPIFNLRFPETDIPHYAARYDNPSEAAAEAFAPAARARGYLTHAELIALGEWKSPRIRPRLAANEPEFVEAATRTAFATPDERLRIEVLTLLHWCHPAPYPILDYRALWSLGIDSPPPYDFPFWRAYTTHCRELTARAGVTMRALDRALWQYSRENQ